MRRAPGPGWPPASTVRSILGFGLVAIGCALLVLVAGALLLSQLTRARALAALDPAGAGGPAERVLAAPAAGTIIGHITSARIGLDAVVLEGLGSIELMQGAGHDPASSLPGEPGNTVFAAHRDMHFRPLRDALIGDTLVVRTAAGEYGYRVTSILVVDPDQGDLGGPTKDERLTLVTCYPFHWIGPAPKRLVVQAAPLGDGRLPSPAGDPDAPGERDTPLAALPPR